MMKKQTILGILGLLTLGIGSYYLINYRPFRNFVKKELEQFLYQKASQHKLDGVKFIRKTLGEEAEGHFTSLTLGPDGKLYAGLMEGKINRYLLKSDGTLELEHTFKLFGDTAKLMIGFCFVPQAQEDSLCAWISYSHHPKLTEAPAWNGNLARIRLSKNTDEVLENTLIVKHLPRSGVDHLTNSIDFGPDGLLYFSQGSNTSMGRADSEKQWLGREESLLAGAILRLDLKKLPQNLPLDAKTPEGGGTYNPFLEDAPLQIYATGIRNAYDLIWHSNGELYTPVNGSMSRKNTPTSNPNSPDFLPLSKLVTYKGAKNIPALQGVNPAQNDFLLRIEQGGYYGHPNPVRGEYILNRGAQDVDDAAYKGIKADPNYRGFMFDFGKHASPNGVIEYKSDRFNGKLKGMLVIARLNIYHDLMLVNVGKDKKTVQATYDGKPLGLDNMNSPLTLVEDPKTGNLYVAEFGGKGGITLFVPDEAPTSYFAKTPSNVKKETETLPKKTTALTADALFEQKCSVCHGELGRGGTGPNLIDEDWIYGGSLTEIKHTIAQGAENGMPAWKTLLSEEDIDKLAKYLLTLAKSPMTHSEP